MPAHYLWYKDGKVTTTRYWEPKFDADENMTEEQAVDEIEKVFEAVSYTHLEKERFLSKAQARSQA